MIRPLASMLALTAALAAGCKNQDNAGGGAEASASEGDSPTKELGQKLNPYVECLNDFASDVRRGRHTWLETFPGKDGPADKDLKHGSLYGPRTLRDTARCFEGLDKAKTMKPSIPELEAAGQKWHEALAGLAPLYKTSNDYFEQGNYKDDKLAWAKQVHADLMAKWAAFDEATSALDGHVEKLEDEIQNKELAYLEKSEGRKIRFLHHQMLVKAKKLVKVAAVNTPAEIDLPTFTNAVADYDKAWTEVWSYYTTNKKEVEDTVRAYWTIESPGKDLLKDAKDLMRRKRDNVKFSTGEKMTIDASNPEAVEGHPARIIKSYNSLIDKSNGINI